MGYRRFYGRGKEEKIFWFCDLVIFTCKRRAFTAVKGDESSKLVCERGTICR